MRIRDFFKQHALPLKGQTLVLAVSGGPDSMALANMFAALRQKDQLKIIVAHFDHQLRPDSYQEKQLLLPFCQKNKLTLVNGSWPLKAHPKTGIEAAARQARYHFLTQIACKYGARYLVTAHHNDDLLENILLKFIRSGNPQEMNSLQAVGKMHGVILLRPLLTFSKEELLEYDKRRHIAFIEDQTNFADDTLRNRLRHHVLPLLKKEQPALGQNALRFSRQMQAFEQVAHQANQKIGWPVNFLGVSYRLPVSKLEVLPLSARKGYWRDFIWQHFHRRVGENLGAFTLKKYQRYFYLWPPLPVVDHSLLAVKVNHPFCWQKRQFLLSSSQQPFKLIGSFWSEKDCFLVGSLPSGTKLPLKNGQLAKAKKMFAAASIPAALRPFCLSVFTSNERPVFIAQVYQDQDWYNKAQQYFIYLLKKQ